MTKMINIWCVHLINSPPEFLFRWILSNLLVITEAKVTREINKMTKFANNKLKIVHQQRVRNGFLIRIFFLNPLKCCRRIMQYNNFCMKFEKLNLMLIVLIVFSLPWRVCAYTHFRFIKIIILGKLEIHKNDFCCVTSTLSFCILSI